MTFAAPLHLLYVQKQPSLRFSAAAAAATPALHTQNMQYFYARHKLRKGRQLNEFSAACEIKKFTCKLEKVLRSFL
jgi:hypothetical protein